MKALEKKERATQEDEEAIRFKQKYMNPNRVVTDIPMDAQEDSSDRETHEQPEIVGIINIFHVESVCYL